MNQDVFVWTGRIRRHLAGVLAHELDLSDATGEEAARVVEEYAEIERLAAVAKLRAARRVAETETYKQSGDKDAAGWFARRTGSSKRDAERSLAAAEALDDLDATRAAAERGELSEQQLREIADAASANPAAEQDLLDAAKSETFAGLKDRALKAKASAGDRRTRHDRIRLSRFLRHGVDAEGAFWMSVRNTADVGARMMAVLRRHEDEVFERNRGRGVREKREAYAADALEDALCGATRPAEPSTARDRSSDDGATATIEPPVPADHRVTGDPSATGDHPAPGNHPAAGDHPAARDQPAAGDHPAAADGPVTPTRRARPPVKVIVRVDLAALRRGHTAPGELADIAGLGPVPVSTIRAMLADAFLATVLTDGIDIRTVTHHGRRPNAFQQTVLELTHPTCDAEGCSRTMFLETDHRTGYAITHTTDLADLDRLCEHHHDLKTNEGWRLVNGRGKRPFVPPDDPRHPDHPPETRADATPTRPRDRAGPTTRRRRSSASAPTRGP